MTEHFLKLKQLIKESEEKGIMKENEGLTGFSGKKMLGALQRFAAHLTDDSNCYLEIGVFQGLTLLSVGSVASGAVYGVDNFAFFDKDGKNQELVNSRIENLKLTNVNLINSDYEDAIHSLKEHIGDKKVSVYFIDGPHDYRSQLVCLLFIKPFLADNAVIIVDDCNYNDVRQANSDFLNSHSEFKLFYQAYTSKHPANMTKEEKKEATDGWWDGVNIIVKDINNILQKELPPTERSRALFENDILVHTTRFPEAALLGSHLAEAYQHKWLRGILKFNAKMLSYFFEKKKNKPPFFEMNTSSEKLTNGKFNKSINRLSP